MNFQKFFFLSFFFLVSLSLCRRGKQSKMNLGVTSLNQACTAQGMAFNQYNITTVEQVNANLYDVFSGNNLQMSVTTTGGSNSTLTFSNAVTSSDSYPTPNDNLTLIFFDLYQLTNQIQLMKDANNNYYVQEWSQPTSTTGPNVLGSAIPIQNQQTTTCFSVKYITSFTVAVDCQDMTQNTNFLFFVNIHSNRTVMVAPTQLLHDNTTSSNNRNMQVVLQQERAYILRTTLYNDWNVSATVNASTLYTFTEVVRLTGVWSTFRPISVFSLPPIQYPGANMNMQVVALAMNSGNLYVLDQLNQALWKITLDFTYITYVMDVQQIGIRGIMNQPLAIGSSQFMFGPIVVAYQGTYKGVTGVYMEEIDPTFLELGPVYQLDSQLTQVDQIYYGSNLIYVTYSNQVRQAFAMFLAMDYFQFNHQSNTTYYAPMVYQQLFDPNIITAFLSNEIASTIIVTQYNSTSGSYSQSLWSMQSPQIQVSQAVTGTITATISCYSGFQYLNATTPVPTQAQATSTVKLNIVAPNYVMGMASPFGPYSAAIGAQTMTIATPGQAIVDLDQFYIAPALTYTVTLTASASSPQGWASDLFSVYSTETRFSNSSFVFVVNGGANLAVGSITFIKPQMILPGIYSWLVESNNDLLYNFIENDGTKVDTFFEFGQPFDISKIGGNIIGFDYFGPEQSVFAGSANPCIISFYSASHSQQLWSTQICDITYEKIAKIKVYGPNVYIIIQGTNSTTTTNLNSIITLQVSNQSFVSQSEFNKMLSGQQVITGSSFLNMQLTDFNPLDVYGDWMRIPIIFIKCSNYVLVYNQIMNYVHAKIAPTWTAPTNYAVAVTVSSLVLIQANRVEEYLTMDLDRIYRIRSAYPYYGSTTQQYLIGDNQYAFSFINVYLYEATTKTLQVFATGNMIPMVFMLFDQISLPVTPIFMFLTKEFRSNYEQITIFGTNYCGIYNIYRRRTLAVSGYFNNSLLPAQTSQTYQFSLIPGSAVGTVQLATIPYTVKTTAVPFTNISMVQNGINSNFIQMKSQTASNMVFTFPSFSWFTGTVTQYYVQCIDQPQECNSTIFMQSPIGPDRLMGNESFRFFDMAAGVNNFSFVQMNNKVLRLTSSENKIYDLVQLPFGEPQRVCLRMAVDPLAQYSISACTQFSMDGWGFYFVSYLSTEPHLMGGFYDSHPTFIEKMIILGNYLFVIEGNVYLNGVHIYQIDFNEDFGDAGAQQYTLPKWLIYKQTLQLNDTIMIRDVKNIDILPTSDSTLYRVFMTSSRGEFLSLDINPEDPTQNMIRIVYQNNLAQILSGIDATILNQDMNIGGVKVSEFNKTSASTDQYTLIVAFKYYNAYEMQAVYTKSATGQLTNVQFTVSIRYQKYAFYEFQNNIQTLPNGFVLLSGYLPDYLSTPQFNYSAHLFMAYDRTNATFQQYPVAGATYLDCYLMGGYPFNVRERFPYMAQTFAGINNNNNYSITLVSPDNLTFFSYTLQRQAGIRITTGSIQSNNIQITAKSEFQSYSMQISIGRDFSTSSKSHPYWVIGVVLGSVAFIVICAVAYWYCKKKKSNSAYTLGEDNAGQQGLAEGN